jgi:hypothetical protein
LSLDPENEIEEGNELNNSTIFDIELSASGTFNAAPAPFATIDSDSVRLIFHSANLKFNSQNIRVQLDTSINFNGGELGRPLYERDFTGVSIGTWDIDLLPESFSDTVQYYWRTVLIEEATLDPVPWTSSSFTYINNSPEGWGPD